MDWSKLMENVFYSIFFIMSILFLYVIFGADVAILIVLSMIYLKLES